MYSRSGKRPGAPGAGLYGLDGGSPGQCRDRRASGFRKGADGPAVCMHACTTYVQYVHAYVCVHIQTCASATMLHDDDDDDDDARSDPEPARHVSSTRSMGRGAIRSRPGLLLGGSMYIHIYVHPRIAALRGCPGFSDALPAPSSHTTWKACIVYKTLCVRSTKYMCTHCSLVRWTPLDGRRHRLTRRNSNRRNGVTTVHTVHTHTHTHTYRRTWIGQASIECNAARHSSARLALDLHLCTYRLHHCMYIQTLYAQTRAALGSSGLLALPS